MDSVAAYEADQFTDDALADAQPHYRAIRDACPVIYLAAHDNNALGRYKDVKAALLQHDKLLSGQDIGGFEFSEPLNIENTIDSNEPKQTHHRKIVATPLLPPPLAMLSKQIEGDAVEVIVRRMEQGSFEAIDDVVRVLPVATVVGLHERGRGRMLIWAVAAFDALGPNNDRAKASFGTLGGMIMYIQAERGPAQVQPRSLAVGIRGAVERGEITPLECGLLMGDIIALALDTTIFAIWHLLNQQGPNLDRWQCLKEDSSLILAAVDKAVRLESPIRLLGYFAVGEQVFDGMTLPKNARMLVMFASANRDEPRWEDPQPLLNRATRPGRASWLRSGPTSLRRYASGRAGNSLAAEGDAGASRSGRRGNARDQQPAARLFRAAGPLRSSLIAISPGLEGERKPCPIFW